LVQHVLDLFPEAAYLARTAVSDKALIYSEEPLVHRVLVIHEVAGMPRGRGEAILRELLSRGHLSYEVTVTDGLGLFSTQIVQKDGPIALLLTTTRERVHEENETRLISIELVDGPAMT